MSYQLKKQVLREHAIHWALKLWHKLPLDESFRSKIKYILFTYFSLFFKNTSKYKRWISFNKNIPIQDITQENESQDILKVAFDTTINKFVEYQENQAINPLVKLIAFYLPQFHPFPENDKWWGKGFTEWSNVGKALPNYVGHYQPHCPIHLGYYDLRIPEIMEEQAKLAKAYGVYGFNYYFYWFAGKVLMEKPLEMMLENKKVDIPFCLTWANENWTRRWDGLENDVLIAQNHSKEDSLEFIRYLIKYFKDERYILIDGKPLLIVYRANIIPDIYAIADSWRKEVRLHGFPDLYLVAAQTFDIADPAQFNFDAAMQFPPHAFSCGSINPEVKLLNPDFKGHFYSYEAAPGAYAIRTTEPDYKLFRSAMLSWDNTARKQNNSHIFYDFSLLRYKQWLSAIINKAYSNNKYSTDEKIIFVNAWNQWAEGTHLEPDQKFGYGYLQATYDALKNYDKTRLDKVHNVKLVQKNQQAIILHLHYVELWEEISDLLFSLNTIGFDLYISITSSDIAAKIRQDFPAAYIMLVDNRGRDILPFIKILSVVNQFDYTAVCKIHSKRSVHRVDGDSLRVEIFNELLRSKEAVNEIILRFKNNKKIGMIAGKKCLFRHNEENMASNSENVKNLAAKLNIDFTCDVFPAGSMFWFRPPALKLLCNLDENLFDIESGFADGTNAHAVERLFCTVVKSSGYTIEAC